MSSKIFFADDELNVRLAMRLLLDQAGYKLVGEAGDTESLLAQVCPSPPDVILLDWELPGLRAQHLLPVLRKYCPHTKVIAVSAQPEAQHTAISSGVDAFVSKGNSSDELLAILAQISTQI